MRPDPDVKIDEDLVRRLLRAQVPSLADQPLRHVDVSGWDNEIVRIGDHLLARLPRREVGADLVRREHRWLPDLAAQLPVELPTALHRGEPGEGYPYPWSIVRWVDGRDGLSGASDDDPWPALSAGQVPLWSGILRALHRPAPVDAPFNPFRSVDLASRADRIHRWVDELHDDVAGPGIDARQRDILHRALDDAVAAPKHEGPSVWLHGDLHAGNVIVDDDRRVVALIDWGDLCAGDPAVDLGGTWMLFGAAEREALRRDLGVEPRDPLWRRAVGWGIFFSAVFWPHTRNDWGSSPTRRRVGILELLGDLDQPDVVSTIT